MNFNEWWDSWGSGIVPSKKDDMESHARFVANAAWNNALARSAENRNRAASTNSISPKLLSQLKRIRTQIECGGKLARLNAIDNLNAVIAQLRA
jgi:hypothetical protein